MGNLYYFANYDTRKVLDGGASRDNAFYHYLSQHKQIVIMNMLGTNILSKLQKFVYYSLRMLFLRKNTILIHQNSILSLYSGRLLENVLYRKVIFKLLNKLSFHNQLFVEINDLRYEQALDLQLPVTIGYQQIQQSIFSLTNCQFIFASYHMRDYAVDKYVIAKDQVMVIVNGGPLLVYNPSSQVSFGKKDSFINYVYAGSLNQGRQLIEVINVFSKKKDVNLYLLGVDGKWIEDYPLPPNIHYLGSLPEYEAHSFVATCDMGLIPYDDTRFYYNLCYPTKASFYITAGIPFLSTDLSELKLNFEDSRAAMFAPLSEWSAIVDLITKELVLDIKNKVNKIKIQYTWESLLTKLDAPLNISNDWT